MKKLFPISILALSILAGCGTINMPAQDISTGVKINTQTYQSKFLSISYPTGYTVTESGVMLIVSSPKGKIAMGGFIVANGYPRVDDQTHPFRSIRYSADKTEGPTVAAALFYRSRDTQTENELLSVLESVKIVDMEAAKW